ncbi:hypothetical protein ACIPZ8_03075 [Pseudomonas sp. NPDC089422]|uniref:hypothetical protein n=1 Tax=Pseudomonas sp. NPDC089422 TaxID=3364466 RepID=UPI00382FFDC1
MLKRAGVDKALLSSLSKQEKDTIGTFEDGEPSGFLGLTWRLSYMDTNLSQAECASSYGFDDVCSATVVAGVSKHF